MNKHLKRRFLQTGDNAHAILKYFTKVYEKAMRAACANAVINANI